MRNRPLPTARLAATATMAPVPAPHDEVVIIDGEDWLKEAFDESDAPSVLIDGKTVLVQRDEFGVLRVAYDCDLMPRGITYEQITAVAKHNLKLSVGMLNQHAAKPTLELWQWHVLRESYAEQAAGVSELWECLVGQVRHETASFDEDQAQLESMVDAIRDLEYPGQSDQQDDDLAQRTSKLIDRLAGLNAAAGEIGAGMLCQLVTEAQTGLSEIPCLRRVEHYTERRLNRSS